MVSDGLIVRKLLKPCMTFYSETIKKFFFFLIKFSSSLFFLFVISFSISLFFFKNNHHERLFI